MAPSESAFRPAAAGERSGAGTAPRRAYALSAIAATVVFLVDISVERVVASAVPYVVVVLLSVWMPGRRSTLALAIATSMLTVLGFFWSPPGGPLWKALANRAVALLTIWVTAVLVLARKNIEAERDRAQEQLAEHWSAELAEWKTRYETAVRASRVVLYDWCAEGDTIVWGGATEHVLGYAADDLGGRLSWWVERIHPDDRARFAALRARPFASQEPAQIEYRVRRADGGYVSVEDTAHVQAGSERRPARMVGLIRDVSEHKRAQEQIRSVVESSPTAMVLVDQEGRIVLVNAEAEHLFGYGRRELLGQPVEILVPPGHRGQHPRNRDEFLSNPQPRRLGSGREVRAVRKDGTEVPVEVGLARITTQDGVFVLGTVADVRQRKQIEAARSARLLAKRVEAAAEAQRKRIAREVHDALGQALTALKLDIGWLSGQLPRQAASLRTRTRAMDRLVEATMQTVQRVAAELRPAVLDDCGLLDAMRWQVGEFEKRTGILCALALPASEIAWPEGERLVAFRVLQESLTNVVRHADASSVEVALREGDGFGVLEVRDNGRGISEEDAARPTSLGLLGMRERASLHGGTLTIRGVAGDGTTVVLRLPIRPRGGVRRLSEGQGTGNRRTTGAARSRHRALPGRKP